MSVSMEIQSALRAMTARVRVSNHALLAILCQMPLV